MLKASYMEDDCPVCGGEGMPLGGLGNRQYYRCRDCGMEFSEDGIEPGRGMAASKVGKLMKRQEKILKDRAGDAMSFDDLPPAVQAALRKVKDQETLWSDVDRWLGDNNNPHLKKKTKGFWGSADGADEKEGKFEKGEDVPLKDMPKELQENVENPPESVKEVTEKIKAKGQSTNKPPGKSALYQATVRLAHAKPHLRAHLLPLLATDDEDEKEGKFERGEDVPLKDMPKELQENVENPPDSVKEVTEKIKAKGQSDNKPPGKRASLFARTARLAHAKPHLRAALLPLLKEARRWPSPTDREPSSGQLNRMLMDSVVDATDGCQVEPDGVCEHGHPSWLLYLGMI